MKCNHCNAKVNLPCLDLGTSPPSNSYVKSDALQKSEVWFPLKILVCEHCWLVQTEQFAARELLFPDDYAYFSSFSSTWLRHAKEYVENVVKRFSLNANSCVVEIAANDGYLLQYVKEQGIPNYGVEPTQSAALAARDKGIEIVHEFFGVDLALSLFRENRCADLMIANNVLAHIPDIIDFVKGFAVLLKPEGVATFEFQHLLRMISENQFDTVYHEHYYYLSLNAVKSIFDNADLEIFDVEELSTHGGSLRIYVQKKVTGKENVSDAVSQIIKIEKECGILSASFYQKFQRNAEKTKNQFIKYLIQEKEKGKKIAAYGAAAKGNTILNYAGIKSDLISYVADKNTQKIGKYLPGSRIPIVDVAAIGKNKPDFVVILPWNLKEEVMAELSFIRGWNGRFVVAIPELKIL